MRGLGKKTIAHLATIDESRALVISEKDVRAIDTLQKAMIFAMQRAEVYAPQEGKPSDDREYAYWLKLVADFAAKLAPYQTPKLQAIYLETKARDERNRPRTIEEVLQRVEEESGSDGRAAFERFLASRHVRNVQNVRDVQAGPASGTDI
jgi:hypothetical protein